MYLHPNSHCMDSFIFLVLLWTLISLGLAFIWKYSLLHPFFLLYPIIIFLTSLYCSDVGITCSQQVEPITQNFVFSARPIYLCRFLLWLGLEILAFPCNQFGGQEPGTNEQIAELACTRFKAEYPIFGKVYPMKNLSCFLCLLAWNQSFRSK